MKPALTIVLAILLGSATYTFAQTTQGGHWGAQDHTGHTQNMMPSNVPLTEPGQGAFASLSEIIVILEADPETDWSHVDLGALRNHLVDMDRLITHTSVRETELNNGVQAIASGDACHFAAHGTSPRRRTCQR